MARLLIDASAFNIVPIRSGLEPGTPCTAVVWANNTAIDAISDPSVLEFDLSGGLISGTYHYQHTFISLHRCIQQDRTEQAPYK